ncbi:MAG: hypothetical protein LBN26_02875 [Christensenellaceae bacterium]|jgi:hypothetical protein|nr:hypothetical protein [Christensenellaceae bacterium]
MATSKTVTKVKAADPAAEQAKKFVPSPENKKKAITFRIIAALLWLAGIAAEVVAILQLRNAEPVMWLLLVLIAADFLLVVGGSMLWKKANRLDPASEKNKFGFFVQNQLGVLICAIAFLPLIVLIFTNKNLKGKQKGILGAVAIVAVLGAGFLSYDYNPPSVEQYTEEANRVIQLTGKDEVYWTQSGTKYHLYDDCYTINTDKTAEIFTGTIADCHADKNITELCKICEGNALKDPALPGSQLADTQEDVAEEETVDEAA